MYEYYSASAGVGALCMNTIVPVQEWEHCV